MLIINWNQQNRDAKTSQCVTFWYIRLCVVTWPLCFNHYVSQSLSHLQDVFQRMCHHISPLIFQDTEKQRNNPRWMSLRWKEIRRWPPPSWWRLWKHWSSWGERRQTQWLVTPKYFMYGSGQIIIFRQPRFPWNKGISLTKPPSLFRLFSAAFTCLGPLAEAPDPCKIAHHHKVRRARTERYTCCSAKNRASHFCASWADNLIAKTLSPELKNVQCWSDMQDLKLLASHCKDTLKETCQMICP